MTLVGNFFFSPFIPPHRLSPSPVSSAVPLLSSASISPSAEHRDTRYDANESTRQKERKRKKKKKEREREKFPLFRLSCAPPYSIYRVAWTLAYVHGGSFGWPREREMGREYGTARRESFPREGRKARDERYGTRSPRATCERVLKKGP